MGHNHGYEYQIKIIHQSGAEELSGWMSSEKQIALAMAAARRRQGKAYWLQERNILCSNCQGKTQRTLEYPLAGIPSSGCNPDEARSQRAFG